MKNSSFYTILCLFFVLISITSCSKSVDTEPPAPPPSNVDVTPVINAARQGTWKVTKYTDHGDDKVGNFAGYNFTFGPNDVLTATDGIKTHIGTWIVSTTAIPPYQAVEDQTPNDPVDFNIYFP